MSVASSDVTSSEIQELMTPKEAADLIGIHVASLVLLAEAGRLPKLGSARGWLFRRLDILRFIEERTTLHLPR